MKKLALVLVIITILTGCPSPQPPQPPEPNVTTTIDEQGKLLTAAISTGCTMSKTYTAINSYYPMLKPFIPANIPIVQILNTFHSALNLYNAAIITWADTKSQPKDFAQLQENLINLNNQLVPIIQQILDAARKSKDAGAVQAANNIDEVNMKGVFSCTIEEFKLVAETVKGLPVLS